MLGCLPTAFNYIVPFHCSHQGYNPILYKLVDYIASYLYSVLMPSVPVYIRNEDYTKWLAIDNKAEFLHEALNIQVIKGDPKNVVLPPIVKPSAIPGVVRGADFVPKPPDPETGYPCCTKRSPCKHWQWDSNQTLWVNSLTGKTREG